MAGMHKLAQIKDNSIMTKKYKKTHKLLKIILVSFCCFCIALVATMFTCYHIVTASSSLSTSLITKNEPLVCFSSFDGEIINKDTPASESGISMVTKNAFIAKEDKRFFKHNGIDYIRILGALKSNILSGEYKEGGSTITQQLIKNTHLTQEKTIKRKLKEIKLAKELEKEFSKEEILNHYLDTVYFGNGINGISGAALYYFNKSAKDLTIAESAILSGIISAPSVYNPVNNLSLSQEKGKMVVNLMEEQGYITESEKQAAIIEIDNISIYKNKPSFLTYLQMAENEALEILKVKKLPLNSNIEIKTYLNINLQKELEKITESEKTKAFASGGTMPGIASMVLDNNSGGIVAFTGESAHNLYTLKRQPASTIKPVLVYGPAFEYGSYSPASYINDEYININGYSPTNATKKYYGLTTIRDNIARSTNVPAVKLLHEIGIEKSKKYASSLGITFHENDNNLALALGGFTEGVTLKELATSYMAIANGGKYQNSGFVKEIIINGKQVYHRESNPVQAVSAESAYLITDSLKSTASYGTARKLNTLNIPIASKTGTNYVNGNNVDGFNVSYTTQHTFLSWIGELGESGSSNDSLYNGSTYPTIIVKKAAEFLYKNNKPQDFVMPSGIQKINLDQTEYLKGNLMIADNYSVGTISEIFKATNLPPARTFDQNPNELSEKITSGLNDTDFNLIYENMIRKYGAW